MSVKDIFRRRTRAFQKHTKNILEALAPVTEVLQEAFFKNTPLKDHIVWDSVVYDKQNDAVFMFGEALFPLGYELELETGEVVVIDEELRLRLARQLQVGIPMRLVEEGDKEKIVAYLNENTVVNETPNDPIVEPFEQKFKDKELTEAQKKQIEFFEEQNKGKLN